MSDGIVFGEPSSRVWGDGIVEDGWSDLLAIRSWDDVEPDQYLRLFPQLVPRDGRIPDRLVSHLEACVSAMAERRDAPAPGVASKALALVLGIVGGRPAAQRGVVDGGDLKFLAGILAQIGRGGRVSPDPAPTALFASLAGVHPVYLWPGAIATHERDTTAGWLGVVARGRPALMPHEVADYLIDAIVPRGDGYAIRDGQIALMAQAAACPKRLLKAAEWRRRGRAMIVRRAGSGVARGWAAEGADRPGSAVHRHWLSIGGRLTSYSGSRPAL